MSVNSVTQDPSKVRQTSLLIPGRDETESKTQEVFDVQIKLALAARQGDETTVRELLENTDKINFWCLKAALQGAAMTKKIGVMTLIIKSPSFMRLSFEQAREAIDMAYREAEAQYLRPDSTGRFTKKG